jgi:hypothetical protein
MRRVVAWVDGISHSMTPTLSSPSPVLSLDLLIIPHRATGQMYPHFTTVLVLPLLAVPTRKMNLMLSIALPSPALHNCLQFPHPHPHLRPRRFQCLKLSCLHLLIPHQPHSRIYHHFYKHHHRAESMAVCIHSAQPVRKTNGEHIFAPRTYPHYFLVGGEEE